MADQEHMGGCDIDGADCSQVVSCNQAAMGCCGGGLRLTKAISGGGCW